MGSPRARTSFRPSLVQRYSSPSKLPDGLTLVIIAKGEPGSAFCSVSWPHSSLSALSFPPEDPRVICNSGGTRLPQFCSDAKECASGGRPGGGGGTYRGRREGGGSLRECCVGLYCYRSPSIFGESWPVGISKVTEPFSDSSQKPKSFVHWRRVSSQRSLSHLGRVETSIILGRSRRPESATFYFSLILHDILHVWVETWRLIFTFDIDILVSSPPTYQASINRIKVTETGEYLGPLRDLERHKAPMPNTIGYKRWAHAMIKTTQTRTARAYNKLNPVPITPRYEKINIYTKTLNWMRCQCVYDKWQILTPCDAIWWMEIPKRQCKCLG